MTSTCKLWCIVYDDKDEYPFQVTAPINNNINELKEHVYEKIKNTSRDVNASNLVLWRVSSFY